ncbi:MAG: dephospho-CoA kinase [Gammaproteobacteria bacterium]|nr:MAG: dephospho-CoA kinase [Gammaproteobacteria bacterium]
MFRVALTGGIASGKSLASRHFESLGVPVIDADQVARELVEPGSPLLERIRERFGPEVFERSGRLDRARLRARVFSNPAERRALEAILHPAIHRRMQALAREAKGPYLVMVIPLLVESGQDWGEDRVLLIDAPERLQRERLMQRDHCSPAQADAILASQASREARRARADDIILNNGDPKALSDAVDRLHRQYLRMATETDPSRPQR